MLFNTKLVYWTRLLIYLHRCEVQLHRPVMRSLYCFVEEWVLICDHCRNFLSGCYILWGITVSYFIVKLQLLFSLSSLSDLCDRGAVEVQRKFLLGIFKRIFSNLNQKCKLIYCVLTEQSYYPLEVTIIL